MAAVNIQGVSFDLKQEGYRFKDFHTRKYVEKVVSDAAPSLFTMIMKAIYFSYNVDKPDAERAARAYFNAFNREAMLLSYYTVGPKQRKLKGIRYLKLFSVANSPLDCYRELLRWKNDPLNKESVEITEQLVRSVFKAQKAIFLELSIALADRSFLSEKSVDELVTSAIKDW